MKFLLQESFRLKNGIILKPHWDEWFDYHTGNAIDYEELDKGIVNLGDWYTVSDNNDHPSQWRIGIDLYCITSNEIVKVTKNCNITRKKTGLITVKSKSGEVFEIKISDIEHPELIRRIADVDDDYFKTKPKIEAQQVGEFTTVSVDSSEIGKVMTKYSEILICGIITEHKNEIKRSLRHFLKSI